VITILKGFWSEERGQDLIEYTLLLAFVCLVAAAVFIGAGKSTSGIWSIADKTLGDAKEAAS